MALVVILLSLVLRSCWQTSLVQAVQQQLPPNFFNRTGCLYVTTTDAGQYRVTSPDWTDQQQGALGNLTYGTGSACISKGQPGLLVMNYDTSDMNFQSMTIEFTIKSDVKNDNWEISKVILTINPRNSQLFPEKELALQPANGGEIYASMNHSYSCSSLVLTNANRNGPFFKITLRRFQLQPFPEPDTRIFAASRDCSSWLTMPQIMGFLLILFMTSTVLIGAYLLLELGNHSSDLRFSKQGGMLMNQAQLDATKAD